MFTKLLKNKTEKGTRLFGDNENIFEEYHNLLLIPIAIKSANQHII